MRTRIRSYVPRQAREWLDGNDWHAWDLLWKSGPRVKFIVARSRRVMRKAWSDLRKMRGDYHKGSIGNDTLGFCHQCWSVREKDGVQTMEVDGRYAAIIVVYGPRVTYEVLAHEAFHAALAVMRRKMHNPDAHVNEMDNEEIAAYPCGHIAKHSINLCKSLGLLK